MHAIIRFPVDLLFWITYLALLAVPAWIIGIPVCYVLARYGKYAERESYFYPDDEDPSKGRQVLAFTPRWAWLWCNEADGVGGPAWWDERVPGAFSWREVFKWSALRNPSNNLRFVPGLHPVPDARCVRYVGNVLDCHLALLELRHEGVGLHAPLWCYAWQGAFAGFWIIVPLTRKRHFRLRIGWKILPRDAVDGAVTDYRRFRYPFGLQFTPWRNG